MQIIGHHKERERLKGLAQKGAISQGYLFVGPQSVGKSLCALEFAAALVGEPDFVPNENKPYPFDVLVVRPEEETKRGITKQKGISAEAMRETLLFLGQFPTKGNYRVVIVEDAHKLSPAAQNVLLKNLEEPVSTAVLILVTHTVGSIVETVLSRVERVRFGYVPQEEIEAQMSSALAYTNAKNTIAPFFYSLGRPGMIFQAQRDPHSFASEQEKLGRLFRLSSLSLGERLCLAEDLSKNVPETIRLLEWWLPGLHRQAEKSVEPVLTTRYFGLLEDVQQTLSFMKTTQSNARLLLEKLLFSL
jgi:hypothetical protein